MRSLFFTLTILHFSAIASDLSIGRPEWKRIVGAPDEARLVISWRNAWHTDRNHDGVWITLRYSGSGDMNPFSVPSLIARDGHRVVGGTADTRIQVPPDRVGLWVIPPKGHHGDMRVDLLIKLDDEGNYDRVRGMDERTLTAHGLEQVFIPEGGFWVGDPDPKAQEMGALHKYGTAPAPFFIGEEQQAIAVGAPGGIGYQVDANGYRGDGGGIVPSDFPKGVHAFWIMKYELMQGQYADLLNDLPRLATYLRSPTSGRDYQQEGGSIVCENGVYRALYPERSCALLSWDDLTAFAAWSGLRPMTELEFEKACRGPHEPVPLEYPWNTSSRDRLKRELSVVRDRAYADGLDEAQLDDANRDVFGVSYYGVFDLAGNVWERCISIGDSVGRAFTGSHGDGNLGPGGTATNADWPKGEVMAPGIGYRGGAFYGSDEPHGNTNPYSPIGYRTYAGWGGAYRYKTYSARFVRTVDR
ncbi:MAG TPA: SUMF1/EgtB/PvdO family nonheme iron enzyme [Flavobacteriales bacterium]|nr:SUMF1/EgtB/PvdO family nonheme iron enzyme [Flavobacteriales bacterium]